LKLPRPRVLYIGGSGRSGSTLMARLLGEVDGFVSVGEIRYVWERGFVDNHLCECGLPFRDCPFWAQVADRAFGGFAALDAEAVRRNQGAVDRIRYVPELLWRGSRTVAFRRHLGEFETTLELLYRAILDVSRATVVVDSSSDPTYGFVLRAAELLDVSVVHLVRDSRAVAYSWTRSKPRPEISERTVYMRRRSPIQSAVHWDVHNLLLEILAARDRNAIRVRYEDLVTDPDGVVRSTCSMLGNLGDAPSVEMQRHSISGNPMRFESGPLRVKLDDEWIEAMAAGDRRLVTLATAPLLARYGYVGRRASR
jgi:Sulfotransferase family